MTFSHDAYSRPQLLEGGATQQCEIRDVGKLIVTLTDPDGNVFGLLEAA